MIRLMIEDGALVPEPVRAEPMKRPLETSAELDEAAAALLAEIAALVDREAGGSEQRPNAA